MKQLTLNKALDELIQDLEPYKLRSVTLRSILLTINDMCSSVTVHWTYDKIKALRGVTQLKERHTRHKISKVLKDIGVLKCDGTLAVSPSGLYVYEFDKDIFEG